LARYKDQFSFFVSEPDNGQADAIAKGFARSSGEIMAYLNSDDLLAPDTLHLWRPISKATRRSTVFIVTGAPLTRMTESNGIGFFLRTRDSWMKRWDFIPQETCFWRRSLFEKAGNVDPSYHLPWITISL